MPLLIILGVIVVLIAIAIFQVNKWQTKKYAKLARKAKPADDAKDEGNKQ